jgi:hypothetical protein
MPLPNYTTQIDVLKTAAEVQTILARSGATGVAMQYVEGRPTAVAFIAPTPFGPREFTLPVHVDKVLMVLRRQRVQPKYQTPEQAERIAWRIVKDWIEAQLAIIDTEMVTIDQVMLPYMRTHDGKTVFERYQHNQFLLEGTTEANS